MSEKEQHEIITKIELVFYTNSLGEINIIDKESNNFATGIIPLKEAKLLFAEYVSASEKESIIDGLSKDEFQKIKDKLELLKIFDECLKTTLDKVWKDQIQVKKLSANQRQFALEMFRSFERYLKEFGNLFIDKLDIPKLNDEFEEKFNVFLDKE